MIRAKIGKAKPAVEARIRQLRAKGDGILKIGKKLGIGTQRGAAGRRRDGRSLVSTSSHHRSACRGAGLDEASDRAQNRA
jgi:hypothetical protein